jgi:hypothetical protein
MAGIDSGIEDRTFFDYSQDPSDTVVKERCQRSWRALASPANSLFVVNLLTAPIQSLIYLLKAAGVDIIARADPVAERRASFFSSRP